MPISYECHIVPKRNCATASCVDAVFGHATHNDQMLDSALPELIRESGFEE